MKYLMINVVCGIRSTGRICTDLATELESEGHEVKIAYGREIVPEQYQKYAVRIGTDFDVKIHAAMARLFDTCGFGSKRATRKFIKWVREYDPDVIYLHNLHGYYINVEVLFDYLRTCGKKIVWTLHDCWAFTGHCAHFMQSDCDKWKTGCYNCPRKKYYPISLLLDRSRQNYTKKKELFTNIDTLQLVTPSKWLADLTRESFLKDYPVEVVYNTVDPNVFKPVESNFRKDHGIEDKKVVLGVASVWDRSKGLDDFCKLPQMLGDDYKIVLVGLNDKQLKSIPSSIIGISRTNSTKELAEIYSASDVFVNPTYEDNYPSVNLEAIACGKKVITYNTGGSPESALANGGVVVDRGDIDSLVDAIRTMLE